MPRGIPNQLMQQDNRTVTVDASILPPTTAAVQLYHQNGGRLTDPEPFGKDPLSSDTAKAALRESAFNEKYPSFSPIFSQLVNGDSKLFEAALKFYVDITYRLSCS